MTCSDVERVLPDIIDGNDDFEFQSHLKVCPNCSELVSDLRMIARDSRHLAATEEPPERVWVRIAAELRAEGLIRDTDVVAARPVVRQRRWNPFWMAPVAVAILAAGSYFVNHQSTRPVTQPLAQQSTPQQVAPQQTSPQQTSPEPPALQQPTSQVAQQAAPQHSPVSHPAETAQDNPSLQAEVSPPASADDQEFLSQVSTRAPGMRATYESQLKAVNNEILETQNYIKLHPRDADARQHLMEMYQQKAMLYQMALDRIQ